MHVPDAVFQELVRCLVESVHPIRIILFGSAARGELREGSDLDLLVVVPDGLPHGETWNQAYRSLRRLPFPKDLVLISEGLLKAHAEDPGFIYARALQEGRELYHAA